MPTPPVKQKITAAKIAADLLEFYEDGKVYNLRKLVIKDVPIGDRMYRLLVERAKEQDTSVFAMLYKETKGKVLYLDPENYSEKGALDTAAIFFPNGKIKNLRNFTFEGKNFGESIYRTFVKYAEAGKVDIYVAKQSNGSLKYLDKSKTNFTDVNLLLRLKACANENGQIFILRRKDEKAYDAVTYRAKKEDISRDALIQKLSNNTLSYPSEREEVNYAEELDLNLNLVSGPFKSNLPIYNQYRYLEKTKNLINKQPKRMKKFNRYEELVKRYKQPSKTSRKQNHTPPVLL